MNQFNYTLDEITKMNEMIEIKKYVTYKDYEIICDFRKIKRKSIPISKVVFYGKFRNKNYFNTI
jgi:hypothetical protein